MAAPLTMTTDRPRRAGLYVRLSHVKHTEQATEDAEERQEERARAMATARGWEVVRLFADTGISAFRAPGQKRAPYRPDFEAALAAIEAREIDALIFFKYDRLVRDHGDFERLLAACEATGAVLVSVVEPIDTSTAAGEMGARLAVMMARNESQNISLRVRAQREQTAGRGLPIPTAWRPFGYVYVPKDGDQPQRYEIIPAEAEIIREAASRVLAGESLNSIARDFDRRGVVPAPPRRNPEKQARGFYTKRLRRILMNPTIAGLRTYQPTGSKERKIIRDATWTPILDRATWERVRAVLDAPDRRRPGTRPHWPLAGLAVCGALVPGEDGELEQHGILLRTKHSHGKASLACDATAPGFKGCGQISIDQGNLLAVVLAMVEARDWSLLAGKLRELAAKGTADPGLAEQLAADEEERRGLARLRALRKIDDDEWLAMREALDERIAAARRTLERQTVVPVGAIDPETPIRDAWPKWNEDQRRAVLRAIFRRVIILPATKRGRGPDPDRVVPEWRV
jgi:site-specific DNA recombinase